MQRSIGLPLEEALSTLPGDVSRPQIMETAAPRRDGQARTEGTLRLLVCRGGVWIAARFLDQEPRPQKEDT